MKNLYVLCFFLIGLNFTLNGCCGMEFYSLTELLVSQEDQRSIMIVNVDSSWIDGRGYFYNRAKVDEVFRYPPKSDQILIRTGIQNSSAGGQLLHPGMYLLVSGSKDGQVYGGFVCDVFSTPLGKDYRRAATLSIIRKYYKLVKEKYTGNLELSLDGNTFAQGTLKNGVPDGKWTHYDFPLYKSDELYLKSIAHYSNGQLHGEVTKIQLGNQTRTIKIQYDAGKILKEQTSIKGTVSDFNTFETEYEYHPDYYLKTSITRTGEDTMHSEKTNLFLNLPYSSSLGYLQTLHGHIRNYHKNGALKEEGEYWWGAKVGIWQYYDTDGTLTEKVYKKPNKPSDGITFFHSTGKIATRGQIKNNVPHGLWKKYFANGKLSFSAQLKYGKFHGVVSKYRSQQFTKWEQTEYHEGLKHGAYYTFAKKDGTTKTATGQYENGKKIGEWKQYYDDGQIKEECTFIDDFNHGSFISYYENGDLKNKCTFVKGVKHEDYIEYNKDGLIYEKGTYHLGQRIGTWKVYNKFRDFYTICDYGQEIKSVFSRNNNYGDECTYEDREGNSIHKEEIKYRKRMK